MRAITLLQTSSQSEVCTQSRGSRNYENFEILTYESRNKMPLDMGLVEKHRIYYKGEGDGFPQVEAVMNIVNLNLPVAHANTKSVSTMH